MQNATFRRTRNGVRLQKPAYTLYIVSLGVMVH